MKELQNFVYRHMDALRHHKRYLAMLTALSMLVTFIVPLILIEPADSMTRKSIALLSNENTTKINVTDLSINISGEKDNMVPNVAGESGNEANGITYSPEAMDILTLLFGATVDSEGKIRLQDIYDGCTTVEEALEVDKETYFLGFASDFCAFIEGDFTATDADAEGRVAVGGNLRFDWDDRKWNYQIGSGDYEVMSPLDEVQWSDDYRNVYGFASALVGGQMFRINTLSTGKKDNSSDLNRHVNSKADTAYYNPHEGLYKYFLVSNTDGFLHYDEPSATDKSYGTECTHDYPGGCSQCTAESGTHNYLSNINELAQMYKYDGIRDLIKETFAYVRSRSDTLAHMQSIEGKALYDYSSGEFQKVLFDAAGVPENTKTVYFTIDDWKGEYTNIEFVNIPEGANIVVNCKEAGIVNISSNGEGGGNGDVITSINGVIISKNGLNDQAYKDAGNANNHPDSARILYNFYNTPEVNIDGCFNGTVLAPYADAYSKKEECTGHLSGALIAKSFYGGLEFGYRPYRGSSDIFGMSSGYEIPVDKLFEGTDEHLSGAMFEIVELIKDRDTLDIVENIISLFESSKLTNYISLPTYIDYTGNTYYMAESVQGNDEYKEVIDSNNFEENKITLSSPLEVYAYKTGSYNDDDLIGEQAIPIQGKFYIKASQIADLIDNDWIISHNYSNSNTYEVYLENVIRKPEQGEYVPVTVTVKNPLNKNETKSVTINFTPMEIKLVGDVPQYVGQPISFELYNYPTENIQFKYFVNGNEIENMNVVKGSYTPQDAGSYTIKVQALYNGKVIAEDALQEITVHQASNPYITVSNESPRVGDTITFTLNDYGDYEVLEYAVENGILNGTSVTLNNVGNCIVKARLKLKDTNEESWISKTIYVSEALVPKLWVSSNTAVAGKDTITFNVYDLPSDVTVQRWEFGSQNGTESNGSFIPAQDGNYTFTVTLSNGNQLTAQINVEKPPTDTSTMTLTATPEIGGETYYKGIKITFGVEGAPSDATIAYKIIYNDQNDITYAMQGNTLTPSSSGKIAVTATVNGVAVPNQLIINIPDYELVASPVNSVVGQEVTLSVNGLPISDGKVSSKITKIEYYIADGNYYLGMGEMNSSNAAYTFNVAQAGDYTVKAIITFDGGSTTSITTKIHTDSADSGNSGDSTEQQVSEANMTYSVKRSINILADESNVRYDAESRKIIITADTENFIERVRLNTEYSGQDYSLRVVMYSGENQIDDPQIISRDQIQNNGYWADITCEEEKKITKVEVEAIVGSVQIKNINVTNLEPCKRVSKTYPLNGEVSETESVSIPLTEKIFDEDGNATDVPIEDFTIKFVENNVKFILKMYDAEGNELAYNNGHDGKWTVSDGQFGFSKNQIFLDNTKNISDVAKIVISSQDNSEFKIGYYSVSLTIGRNEKVNTVSADEVVEEHTYIIREDTAPQGFVKTDEHYKVVIKETIAISEENILDNLYPKDSNAVITIYKSNADATFDETTDYNTSENYTVFSSITLDISNDYDSNTRTIKYGDNTFVITRDTENVVQTVTANGTTLIGDALIENKDNPQAFTYNGERYYYNPVTAMVIPLPAKNLVYENAPGLHFQKVDDIGLPVKGATIKLQANGSDVNDTSLWLWNDKTVQTSLNIAALNEEYPGAIFSLVETSAPSGYDESDPLYFKIVNANGTLVIHYATSESDLNTDGKFKVLDIVNNRVMQMIDMRILGTELKLRKVEEGTDTFIGMEGDYATFSLYADNGSVDGILIKENIVINSEGGIDVDLSDVSTELKAYVENGYLKPGKYFLVETNVPEGYMSSGAVSFRVDKDFNIVLTNEKDMHILMDKTYGWNSGNTKIFWHYGVSPDGDNLLIENPSKENPDGLIGIPDVVKIVVEADKNLEQCYFTNKDVKSHNKTSIIVEYKEPVLLDKFKMAAPEDTKFTKIEITTADEEVYYYDPNYVVETLNDIKIGNKKDNGIMELEVRKLWKGDEAFAAYRPEVEVNLYRTTTAISDYNNVNLKGDLIETIRLNASNRWKYKFEELPTKDENENLYYYYIRESDAPLTGYTDPVYGKTTKGALTVTNTLDPVNIKVQKHWVADQKAKPEQVVLRLQIYNEENKSWENVYDKILVVTGEDWSGTIEGLLKGKKYRLTENSTVGWEPDPTKQETIEITSDSSDCFVNNTNNIGEEWDTDDALDITNKPKESEKGSLQLNKSWSGDTLEDRPDELTFKIYRIAKSFYPEQTAAQVQQDYARLLQYSLYFYDANMCGNEVDEHSALAWRAACHTEDDTNAIAGGYHDAGDHVMFGLPQGYSATMLGWSLYEFNTTADDDNKVYDKLNQTAHYKLISDHYNDFFAQCIRTNTETGKLEVLVQKGDGDIDHLLWGKPETQQDRTEEMVWSETGADIAAEYAASLALSYLNFYDSAASEEEKAKYENHLAAAKKLFDFADKGKNNRYGNSFYSSGSDDDDRALAAGWLYLATVKEGNPVDDYKNKCNKTDTKPLTWDEVYLAAACVKAHIDDISGAENSWSKVTDYITGVCDGSGNRYKHVKDGYYSYYKGSHDWGTARHNALTQTVALAVAKNIGEGDTRDKITDWCKQQMSFILGNNEWKDGNPVCLVTGFAENSTKYAHHRAAAGWDDHEAYKINPTYDSDGHIIIGGLAGGPAFTGHNDQQQMKDYGHTNCVADHVYLDDLHDYCCNEVALDYNAGLVGAAAGLYYFYGTGHTYEIPGVEVQYLQPESSNVTVPANVYSLLYNRGASILAGERSIVYDSSWENFDEFLSQNGADVSDLLGKNVTKITVEFENDKGYSGCELKLNGTDVKYYNGNLPLTFTCYAENNQYAGIYGGTIASNNISMIRLNIWNVDLKSVTVYYEVAGLSINDATIVEGDTVVLETSGKAEGQTVTWTLPDGSTATGDTYSYTAGQAGEVTFTVTDGTNNATKKFTIQELAISGDTSMNEGETKQLGINSNKGVSGFNWSISEEKHNIATIDQDGNVTAHNAGSVTVTAQNGNYSATYDITVIAPTPTLTIDQTPINLSNNEKATLTITPSGGTIEYFFMKNNSSAQGLSIVDGVITPSETGTYYIWVKRNGVESNQVTLTVNDNTTLTLGIDNGEININGETYLRPNPNDSVTYTYSGNQGGLQIDSDGKVTGLKAGSYVITATRDGKTATVNLTVREMGLNTPTTKITVGGSGTQWSINNLAVNGTVNWTSENTGVATVDSNGNITAVSAGDAVIKATVSYNGNNVTFEETITVSGSSSSGGSGSGSTGVTTPKGYELIHKEIVDQSFANTSITDLDELTDKKVDYILIEFYSTHVDWGGSGFKGKIGYNGNMTEFDYTSNDYYTGTYWYDFKFNSPLEITSIDFENHHVPGTATIKNIYFYKALPMPTITGPETVMVGNSIEFTYENFSGTDITWSVTNEDGSATDLAEIDQNGKLTAKGKGTVKVIATRGTGDNAETDDAIVTIIPFAFNFESGDKAYKVHVGKDLTVTFDTDKTVEMTITGTNNGNVSLNGNTFTGLQSTDGQTIAFKASCNREEIEGTIEVIPDLKISCDGELPTFTGRTLNFTAENAAGNVTWSVDNSGGTDAVINQNGVLTVGSKTGKVKVIATDGQMTVEYEVEVKPGCAEVELPEGSELCNIITLKKGENFQKLVEGLDVYDENGNYYCYYIVECDNQYNPITSGGSVLSGSGTMYVPTAYVNNGMTLDMSKSVIYEVSNALSSKIEGMMPSTGGDGTTKFYSLGALLMLLSAAGFTSLKRRERKRRKE